MFSRRSLKNLYEAKPILQKAAHIVVRLKDHSIIEGHRPQEEQDAAFDRGASKLKWPHGKHNALPSNAIDVQTYPRPDNERDLREEQLYLLGLYRGVLHMLGHNARTGADWDRDGEIADNGFDDLFHVEIVDD